MIVIMITTIIPGSPRTCIHLDEIEFSQPVENFYVFFFDLFGTKKVSTLLTRTHHLSISWAKLMHSISLRHILLLFSHLRLSLVSCLFLWVFVTNLFWMRVLSLPSEPYIPYYCCCYYYYHNCISITNPNSNTTINNELLLVLPNLI
jgi:hypothetical protein